MNEMPCLLAGKVGNESCGGGPGLIAARLKGDGTELVESG